MKAVPGAELVVDVVVLARDAAPHLGALLRRVPSRRVRSVVVVDHGSNDSTAAVAHDAGAVVLRESRGGEGAALRRAVAHLAALPRPSDAVVIMRGDGTDDPEQIASLLAPLALGEAELVLGDPGRRAGSRVAAAGEAVAVGMIGAIYRHRFTTLSKFRAVHLPALVALGLSDDGPGWAAEMQIKAVRLGLRIVEVPVARVGDGRSTASRARRTYAKLGETSRVLFHILRHSTAR